MTREDLQYLVDSLETPEARERFFRYFSESPPLPLN